MRSQGLLLACRMGRECFPKADGVIQLSALRRNSIGHKGIVLMGGGERGGDIPKRPQAQGSGDERMSYDRGDTFDQTL